MIGWTEAKAIENDFFVGHERKLGDQNRLETDVVLAVNGAFQRIFFKGCLSIVIAVSFTGSVIFYFFLEVKINKTQFFFCSFLVNKKEHEPFIPNG